MSSSLANSELAFQQYNFDHRLARDAGSISARVARVGGLLSGPDRTLKWELRRKLEPLVRIFLMREEDL